MQHFDVHPIGTVRVSGEDMLIELEPRYAPALQALDGFGHINVIWWFSHFDDARARDVLETPQPYKNAPDVMGIFATRSPVRPNPIALSAAEVISIDPATGIIRVAYIDADDGTPVLDIKPYTPSLDRVARPHVPAWCAHWPDCVEDSADFDWVHEFTF